MALEYTERTKVEPTFYRNCFRGAAVFTAVLVLCNLLLSWYIAHWIFHPKPTQWIVTTVDGRLIKI